jgi:hypothetical protein
VSPTSPPSVDVALLLSSSPPAALTTPVPYAPEVLCPHTRSRSGIIRSKEQMDGTIDWYTTCMAHAIADPSTEPHTFQAAMTIPHWREAT